MTGFSGIVFDLDGTITDNMAVHADAFALFVKSYGLPPLTHETRAKIDGKRNRDIFPMLFERDLPPEELARYIHEKESLYRELSHGRLTTIPGLDLLLDRAESLEIPVAIATSAPPENVEHTLGVLGLRRRFPVIVRSDEVPRGKPFPDVFLAAARAIHRDPISCLAFEDAPMGIASARNAGMTTIALATSFTAPQLLSHDPRPHAVVRDYNDFLASDFGAGFAVA